MILSGGGLNDVTHTVSIRNPSITPVSFAVWSAAGGQNDVVWIDAQNKGNGIWSAELNCGSFLNDGTFIVHAYSGEIFLKAGSFTWNAAAAKRNIVINEANAVLNGIGRNLRAAFDWSKSIRYDINALLLSQIPAGADHMEYMARMGFEQHYGNCYVMAACFTQMARVLGYDAHLIEGQVPYRNGSFGPHGWCEIDIGGTTYVFDPDFEYQTGKNGYYFTYGTSGTWRYANAVRVN